MNERSRWSGCGPLFTINSFFKTFLLLLARVRTYIRKILKPMQFNERRWFHA
nr:MAG TPA: hypothetical protein [Caudoviricetes sp.]